MYGATEDAEALLKLPEEKRGDHLVEYRPIPLKITSSFSKYTSPRKRQGIAMLGPKVGEDLRIIITLLYTGRNV